MKELFRGALRLIKLFVKTVRETVFAIPARILKRIGGANPEYSSNQFWTELFKLWLLMIVATLIGLPAFFSNLLAYLVLAIIGEIIYVTAMSYDDAVVETTPT